MNRHMRRARACFVVKKTRDDIILSGKDPLAVRRRLGRADSDAAGYESLLIQLVRQEIGRYLESKLQATGH
jgi:hypothetical protein